MFFETLLILYMLYEVDYIILFTSYMYLPFLIVTLYLYLHYTLFYLFIYVHVLLFVFQKVRESELGDAVVVDVDENTIKTCFNDLEELPSEIVSLIAL